MRAWEILGDPELRESYDRVWRLRQRGEWLDEESSIPHVTESPLGRLSRYLLPQHRNSPLSLPVYLSPQNLSIFTEALGQDWNKI